jgi:hypothetical protein
MTDLPTTEQWQAMLTEHVARMTDVMDTLATQRDLIDDYRRTLASVEAQLARELAQHRELRKQLRQLASHWSRKPTDDELDTEQGRAWLTAERELSAILDVTR